MKTPRRRSLSGHALIDPRFAKRVVRDRTRYTRKTKHKPQDD